MSPWEELKLTHLHEKIRNKDKQARTRIDIILLGREKDFINIIASQNISRSKPINQSVRS